jgi:hypothetical protein
MYVAMENVIIYRTLPRVLTYRAFDSKEKSCPKTDYFLGRQIFALKKNHYLRNAVRGAKSFGLAEMIPYEPEMYNDSAGKR